MAQLQKIKPRYTDVCVVAATGPSLTPDVAKLCKNVPVIAVNDAWRLFPFADVLYAGDGDWWDVQWGCPYFDGEKWSSHSLPNNDKTQQAKRYGLNLVRGDVGDGFSTDPARIHYGLNSGFQAVNLAILFGAKRILLVGFDMRGSHFFGDHPAPLHNVDDRKFTRFLREFERASPPQGVGIINCTPDSALRCYPMADLEQALKGKT